LAHELAIARAVGDREECGANKMQAERTACGQCVITIESIMPIILEHISTVERLKAARRADKLLTSAALAYDMMWSVLDQHKQRHGPGDITDDLFATLEKGFDQWVPFFQESGQPTDINESQLIQMFGHANTHLPAHQSAPQEPRTPEQATHVIPAVTPPKLELRAFLPFPREPEDLRTGMEQEEALLVVAMYGADTLVRAVGRGLVARRLMDALLAWRTEQILSAIGDAQKDWCRSGDQLLREIVRMQPNVLVLRAHTAVMSWRRHLPTGKQMIQGGYAVTRTQQDMQGDTQKESLYCPMHVQVQQPPLAKSEPQSTQQSTPLRPVQQGGTQPPLKEPRLQPVRQPSPQPTPSYHRTAALLEKISGALLEENQRVSRLWPTKLCLLDKGFVAWLGYGAWLAKQEQRLEQRLRREKASALRDEKMLENERMAQQRWEQQQQPCRRSKILQDEHGCYQDMEANGHRTGDDMAD
jgi:hypothetical protein